MSVATRRSSAAQAADGRHHAELGRVRRRIDSLDEKLLKLVNDRAALALAIGRIKDKQKWPIFDAKRELFVLKHVMEKNGGPLSTHAVRHIFQAILCECRRRQRARRQLSRSA